MRNRIFEAQFEDVRIILPRVLDLFRTGLVIAMDHAKVPVRLHLERIYDSPAIRIHSHFSLENSSLRSSMCSPAVIPTPSQQWIGQHQLGHAKQEQNR